MFQKSSSNLPVMYDLASGAPRYKRPIQSNPVVGVSTKKPMDQHQIPEGVSITVSKPELFDNRIRGGRSNLAFTVSIAFQGFRLLTIPDFRIIDGRIQVPSRPVRTPEGLLQRKVVVPVPAILHGVHKAVLETDWATKFPNIFPLAPIFRNEDEQD